MQHPSARGRAWRGLALAIVSVGCGGGPDGAFDALDHAPGSGQPSTRDAAASDRPAPPPAIPDGGSSTSAPDVATPGPRDGAAAVDGAGLDGSPADIATAAAASALSVTPEELVWSGVRGTRISPRTVTVRNVGSSPVTIGAISLTGPQTASFAIEGPSPGGQALAPGAELTLRVAFVPPGSAMVGVHRASLRLERVGAAALEVGLFGLATVGEQGSREPSLKLVVEALGFAVDVGGGALHLGTSAAPIGDEVLVPRFVRAGAAPLSLTPVARYSPDELLPFGIYTGSGTPVQKPVAAIATGQEQTLYPALVPGGTTTFDPGGEVFGIYVKSRTHTTYTEDRLNTGPTRHAARIYPLKDRAGRPVAHGYLVCFEEAANGDYQDYVFVLQGAKPAP